MAGEAGGQSGQPDPRPFKIGLVMAGAVSAGAYTAGVVDFLLEALDAIADVSAGRDTAYLTHDTTFQNRDRTATDLTWPDMKPVVAPPYRAQIAAMSGASAGAMITAIAGTILNTRVPPVTEAPDPGRTTGNPLYDCWVEQISIDKLLTTSDLSEDTPLRSVLNSDPLTQITRGAVSYAQRTDHPRPYVADPLPIHMCVGNLRGVPYSLRLKGPGAEAGHQMTLHADNVAFEITHDAFKDDPLGVCLVPGAGAEKWERFGMTCLASGAFPIGLAPRVLKRNFQQYVERKWFIPGADAHVERRKLEDGHDAEPATDPMSWEAFSGAFEAVPPLYGSDKFPPAGDYEFVCVDGGVFNNEPLELCRRSLAGQGRNPRDPDEAHAAVLLIDPFPDLADDPAAFKADEMATLVGVAKRLFGTLIAQSRFKPDELALARKPNVASRFAILPSRADPQTDAPLSPAIACGTLQAFGGFLSRDFRHHDYMLGRRNCQRFLARHFVLPADPEGGSSNPIVETWLKSPDHKDFLLTGKDSPFKISPDDWDGAPLPADYPNAHPALPIIPLLGKLASASYTAMPDWPSQPADLRLGALDKKITARLDAVVKRAMNLGRWDWLAQIGWRIWARGKLRKWVMAMIREDLEGAKIRPGE